MERETLVVRRRSPEDRRVVHIELTAKGRKLAGEIRIEPMEIFRTVLQELSTEDAADLRRIVTRLARRVGELVRDSANGVPEELVPEAPSKGRVKEKQARKHERNQEKRS
jgi:hypothetical protein